MADFKEPSFEQAVLQIERFLVGDASASERESIQRWLAEHPAFASAVERYRTELWTQWPDGNGIESYQSLARLHEKLTAAGLETLDGRSTRTAGTWRSQVARRANSVFSGPTRHTWVWTGAVATVIAGIGLFVLQPRAVDADVTRSYVDERASASDRQSR